jgi:hypothetical protein
MYVLRSIWRSAREDITGIEAQALEYEARMGREAFERQWTGAARAKARLKKLLGAR